MLWVQSELWSSCRFPWKRKEYSMGEQEDGAKRLADDEPKCCGEPLVLIADSSYRKRKYCAKCGKVFLPSGRTLPGEEEVCYYLFCESGRCRGGGHIVSQSALWPLAQIGLNALHVFSKVLPWLDDPDSPPKRQTVAAARTTGEAAVLLRAVKRLLSED